MFRKAPLLCLIALSLSSPIFSEMAENQEGDERPATGTDVEVLSQALGHIIGKYLIHSIDFPFDISQIARGMEGEMRGEDPPLSESECIEMLSEIQEISFQKLAAKNLESAEAFMERNGEEEGIVQVEKDVLHYRIKSAGQGAQIEEDSSPAIRYTGYFLDGKEFDSSHREEGVVLHDPIPALKRGMIGMREGEERTLYIHPKLGYGTEGTLPPNSLLIFDVELVKADVGEQEGLSPSRAATEK